MTDDDEEDEAIIRNGVITQAEREIEAILQRVEFHCRGEVVATLDLDTTTVTPTVRIGMAPA